MSGSAWTMKQTAQIRTTRSGSSDRCRIGTRQSMHGAKTSSGRNGADAGTPITSSRGRRSGMAFNPCALFQRVYDFVDAADNVSVSRPLTVVAERDLVR